LDSIQYEKELIVHDGLKKRRVGPRTMKSSEPWVNLTPYNDYSLGKVLFWTRRDITSIWSFGGVRKKESTWTLTL
jgi:hypothetical protein